MSQKALELTGALAGQRAHLQDFNMSIYSAHQLQGLLDSKNSLSQGIGLKYHEAKRGVQLPGFSSG